VGRTYVCFRTPVSQIIARLAVSLPGIPTLWFGLLADQEEYSCGDCESWRYEADLPKRDSKQADHADENQVNGKQQHSNVVFHVNGDWLSRSKTREFGGDFLPHAPQFPRGAGQLILVLPCRAPEIAIGQTGILLLHPVFDLIPCATEFGFSHTGVESQRVRRLDV